MATHVGDEGVVKIGSNTIAEVSSWSIEESGEAVEDTALGDTWRTYVAGNRTWSGTIECHWDETDTNGQGAMTTGASVTLNLYPEGAVSTDVYYTGSAIITGISRQGSINGIVSASYSFQGTSTLTEATVT